MKHSAVPLRSRLMRTCGNVSNLDAANSFLAVMAQVFVGQGQLFTLVDSWYMKWPFLCEARKCGFTPLVLFRNSSPPSSNTAGKSFLRQLAMGSLSQRSMPGEIHERVSRQGLWIKFEDSSCKLSKQRLLLSTCAITTQDDGPSKIRSIR